MSKTQRKTLDPLTGGRAHIGMIDVPNPPIRLLAKLGSIIVHADELTSGDGHEFDATAIRSLIADGEVREWLRKFEEQYPSVLPRKRRA